MTITAKTQNMNLIKSDSELIKTLSLTTLHRAVFYSGTCYALYFRQPVWQLDQSELLTASSGHSDGEEELQEERIWSSDAGGFLLHIPRREVSGCQHSIITQHGCRSAIVLHLFCLNHPQRAFILPKFMIHVCILCVQCVKSSCNSTRNIGSVCTRWRLQGAGVSGETSGSA